MATATQDRIPFIMGTRRRRAKVATRSITAGQSIEPVTLPSVGYLSSVYLLVEGTATLSGAGALAGLSPWNMLGRIQLDVNMASASLWNTTGWGAYVTQRSIRDGFSPELGGIGSNAPRSDVYAAPVAAGANTVRFGLRLPVGWNTGAQAPFGLVNLQAPEVRCTLNVMVAAATEYAALCTGFTGTLHVFYEYFDVPNPAVYTQPPLMLVRVQEDIQAVAAAGDNTYTVPRQGMLLNLIHTLRLDGSRSEEWDSARVVFNKTDTPIDDERRWHRFREREVFGINPVDGVIHHNFADADDRVNGGATATPQRDALDTQELTTLESIVKVSAGATLGVGNNTLSSVRRFVQSLEAVA